MMSRALPTGGPVPSPCTSVCVIHPRSGLCAGCLRTLDEIAEWSLLDDDAKREVWMALAKRQSAAVDAVSADESSRTAADADR
jgi:uncharacterized protein